MIWPAPCLAVILQPQMLKLPQEDIHHLALRQALALTLSR
jgi:hypothetical protein